MKRLINIFVLTLILTTSCNGQQIMKTLSVNDAKKLKINKERFINKPLKELLLEIHPKIKMVTARSSGGEGAGRFSFRFVDLNQDHKIGEKGKTSLRITVYIKEAFVWDNKKSLDGKKLGWDKEDEKTYGNLTVIGIDVSGEEVNQ